MTFNQIILSHSTMMIMSSSTTQFGWLCLFLFLEQSKSLPSSAIIRYVDNNCITQSKLPSYQSPYVSFVIGTNQNRCNKDKSFILSPEMIVLLVLMSVIVVGAIVVFLVFIVKRKKSNHNYVSFTQGSSDDVPISPDEI